MENYTSKSHYSSGVNLFWPKENNQPVIDAINKLNDRRKALSSTTYEFATLYSNIHKIN